MVVAVDLRAGDDMSPKSSEQIVIRRSGRRPEIVEGALIRQAFKIEEGLAEHLDWGPEAQRRQRCAGIIDHHAARDATQGSQIAAVDKVDPFG